MAHLQMVYLLNMVIFHGKLLNNQMVIFEMVAGCRARILTAKDVLRLEFDPCHACPEIIGRLRRCSYATFDGQTQL